MFKKPYLLNISSDFHKHFLQRLGLFFELEIYYCERFPLKTMDVY